MVVWLLCSVAGSRSLTMDVLRPDKVYIGNRCYRKNKVQAHVGKSVKDQEDFNVSDKGRDEYEDESCSAGFDENIKSTAKGFQLVLHIPNVFYKHIIGRNGETKKRMESETRTRIEIPRQREDGDIVITGCDKAGVISARTRIDVLISSARRRLTFTHFLSFPVGDEDVRVKFDQFKDEVLQACAGDRGIDNTIFQNRHKLHLTVGTMILLDEQELQQATEVLRKCQEELFDSVLQGEPLTMEVRGLEYMNDDPHSVDVLYAKVSLKDKSNRLQTFADRLVDQFAAAGFMKREHEHVKLHITVMNSLMRRDPSGTTVTQTEKQWERESFDAANVLKLFRDYHFGDCRLDSLHISQRSSASRDAYYTSAASVQLP